METTYIERFSGESQEVDLSMYPPAEPVDNAALIKPITPEEVVKVFSKANKDTAVGPGQIDLKLIAEDRKGIALSNLFNTWLFTGKVPKAVKENRSIPLPKGTECLDSIINWRPLAISTVVIGIYTNILATRTLNTFKINERQRGFIKAAGCSENGFLIGEIIK